MKRLVYCALAVLWALTPTEVRAEGWSQTSRLITARFQHTATLLQNGNVLVAGGINAFPNANPLASAELYDFRTGVWTATGALGTARGNHTATLLPNGEVLVAGGLGPQGVITSSEVFNPATGEWSPTQGGLNFGRQNHTATLLRTGEVLVTGGVDPAGNVLAVSELFDPSTGLWSVIAPLNFARTEHTATLLSDGRVLVAGGLVPGVALISQQEIFDPASNSWTVEASLPETVNTFFSYGIAEHQTIALPGGNVLIAGGMPNPGIPSLPTFLYSPSTNVVSPSGGLVAPATSSQAVLLADGRVVLMGGEDLIDIPNGQSLATTQVWDPSTNAWTAAPPLAAPRMSFTATLLPNGKVLAAGGIAYQSVELGTTLGPGQVLSTAEVFDPTTTSSGAWTNPVNFNSGGPCLPWPGTTSVPGCPSNPAILLPSGQVFFVSTSVLWDPSTGNATTTTPAPFVGSTLTLLVDGRVLMTGGTQQSNTGPGIMGAPSASAALYNPATGTWTQTSMQASRVNHTATLLPDGRVLVAGGTNLGTSAEVFDPRANGGAGSFTFTGTPMAVNRQVHTATLLGNGLVLLTGGQDASGIDVIGTSELFDEQANGGRGAFTTTGSLGQARTAHTATLLEDGRVLVAGGWSLGGADGVVFNTAEIYDPTKGTWSFTGTMVGTDYGRGAALLEDGTVLVAGGGTARTWSEFGIPDGSSEIYDPVTGTWHATGSLLLSRFGVQLLPLPSSQVLAVGGTLGFLQAGDNFDIETFDPGLWNASRRPVLNGPPADLVYGTALQLSGTGLRGDSEASGGGTNNSPVNVPLVQLRALEGGQVTWIVPDPLTTFGQDPLTLNFSNLPSSLNPGFQMATVVVDGLPSVPLPGGDSLVGVTCSVAILTEPQSVVVPLGTPATFSVSAQGARTYQWQEDTTGTGLAFVNIPGATGASYTTPPISGADSGTLFRVFVTGACAQALSSVATLTAFDTVPPTVSVVSPNGGEFWLLSPSGGPANVEEISWLASDNVRVCRTTLSLEYSNDGGVTYTPAPAGGALPATLGSGGSCAYPGVTTQSLSYALPSAYPSGRPGSLYRIRVTASDQVGNTTSVTSQNPFYMVQSNPNVQTLILTNSARIESLYPGRGAALQTKLGSLALQSRVQGFVLDLAGIDYSAFDAAVAAADGPGSVAAANTLLFATGGIHDRILATLPAFPSVKYLVLVGDDRVIPFARIQDGTTLFDETNYPAGGDISPTATSVGLALAANTYLSDNPISLTASFPQSEINISTFLPDLIVGRLVETPEEISTTIATFIAQDGILDLSKLDPAAGHKVLVTGYDFFSDSATQIDTEWKSLLGASSSPASLAPVDGQLIGADWGLGSAAASKTALEGALCGNGGAPYGVLSLSGHANHYLEGIPNPSTVDGVSTTFLSGPTACGTSGFNLLGGVLYAVGCHAGLPVPGSDPTDINHSLDLAETFLSHGVAAYVANSGYGWATVSGPGYGKRLMQYLTETLAVPGTNVMGDGVVAAKLRYYDESPSLDPYDQKTLMQWTFYGLPMYAVKTAATASSAVVSSSLKSLAKPAALAPLPGQKEAVERFGQAAVTKAAVSPSPLDLAAPLPNFLTELDLRFDFSAPGVYTKLNSAGGAVSGSGCPDPNGCYYALNGVASGQTDLPVQPYFVYDSRLSGTSQHGVLWLGGTFVQESGWTPIITTLVSNGGNASNHGVATQLISGKPGPTRRVPGQDPTSCATSDAEVNTLVVNAGELLAPDGVHYTTERHYDQINMQTLYFNDTSNPSNNCDRTGPQIAAGPYAGGLYHQVASDGTTVEFAVPASDPSGVWRVVVVLTDNTVNAQGQGTWQPVELTNDGTGTFRGSFSFPSVGQLTYMIQAVDNLGNVSWLNFVAVQLPASGVSPNIPLPTSVSLSGPAGPSITSFAPPAGIVGTTVSIQGQNFTGATRVAFGSVSATFVVSASQLILASVPPGAVTAPISVTTPYGTAASATSFVVQPAVSVADTTVTKPASGTTNAVFPVTLSFSSGVPVTVAYTTADGSAVAGTDYHATSGTLTFAPGTTSLGVNVAILGSEVSGGPLTFTLNLSNPTNSGLARPSGTGTIQRPWRVSDFNGDGGADILWQDQSTGNLAAWLMSGTTRTGVASFNPAGITDPNLQVAGFGDLNGDGHTDLVLENQTTGALTVWLLNGTVRTGTATIAAPGAAWRVAGIADMNGDGRADIVWQNLQTNQVMVTYLVGTTPTGTASIAPTRTNNWKVRGVSDFNGDGSPDLLWQDQTTGNLEVWYLHGVTETSSAPLVPNHPTTGFLLAGVGDLNADGKPDLLFKHALLGTLQVWLMNGVTRTSVVTPGGVAFPGEIPGVPGAVIDPRWKVVGPR